MNKQWIHQDYAFYDTVADLTHRERSLLITSPTGGGKTNMMERLLLYIAAERGEQAILLTHRRWLLEQTALHMSEAGVHYGYRAAGKPRSGHEPVQLAMTQTEINSVRKGRPLFEADYVLVDEAHVNQGEQTQRLLYEYKQQGAKIIGYTATPLDVVGYDKLIIAGRNSSLRMCGAIVPAMVYGPDEPNTSKIHGPRSYKDPTFGRIISPAAIFARVFEHWQRLNPNQEPTLLFGPDVGGSLYFAEQFYKHGIPAAHVEASKIWMNGEWLTSTDTHRKVLEQMSRNGDLPVVCNRFVMREGVNWPHLQHGIVACTFGKLQSYLQAVGRLLRACPELGFTRVILQDHGGNWWRFGSPNDDRYWQLGTSDAQQQSLRRDKIRAGEKPEPLRCPRCAAISYAYEAKCPACGFMIKTRTRIVIELDGRLQEMKGRILPPRYRQNRRNTAALWRDMYYRAKNSRNGMTFKQAEGLFFRENGYWPPRDLPLMPVGTHTWFRRVRDVPQDELTWAGKGAVGA